MCSAVFAVLPVLLKGACSGLSNDDRRIVDGVENLQMV